ncbi:unnamed protein product [Calypogeia fissa]
MKEGAARAVLREAWLRGQRCVELQRDGKRTIFVCTKCGTRCYSDAALVDHLQGNMHARRSVALTTTSEKNSAGNGINRDNSVEEQQQRWGAIVPAHQDDQRAIVARGGSELEEQRPGRGGNEGDGGGAGAATSREFLRGAKIVLVDPRPSVTIAAGGSKTALEWIGSGELFFSVRSSAGTANTSAAPAVDSSWFNWKGKGGSGGPSLGSGSGCQVVGQQGGGGAGAGGHIAYAVVKFPYSDMIGRGGDWKPTWSTTPDSKHQQTRSSSGSYGLGHQQQAEERLLVGLPTQTPTSSLKASNNVGATNNTHGQMHHQALAVLPVPKSNNSPQPPSSVETISVVDKNVPPSPELGLVEKQQKLAGLGKGSTGSSRILRRVCKRKKAKAVERLCFICHQRMSSGKDVAALLNLHTKQMVCGSRNKRGVFHVYHSSCLIDWISICEVKTFTGQVDHRIDHTRKLTRTRRAIVEQSRNAVIQGGDGGGLLSTSISEGAIFCPECQGTGLKLRGAQLERPRYRLAQVFDWILELIQARKAWTDNPKKQDTSRWGLLFHEDQQQGTVQSRGLVHYYSGCADLLTGNALERQVWTYKDDTR